MAVYVYRESDGSLYSWSPNDTDPVADNDTLAANGFAAVIGLPSLDSTHGWDTATKTIVAVVPPPLPKPIGTGKWIMRFTSQEFQAISTSTDAIVEQFMYALNHTTELDLSDSVIVTGVNYLASINLIAADRVSAILAGV